MNRVSVFLAIWVVSAGAGFAQKVNPLRDSLRVAADSLAYHPDRIDLRLKKASWNVQLEEWNYAKEEYDRVLSKDADNPTALYFRAYVNEKLSRYNFARLDYQHLLYIVPGNFEAQLGLALLNEKDKHFTEAFDGINRLIAHIPTAQWLMQQERIWSVSVKCMNRQSMIILKHSSAFLIIRIIGFQERMSEYN